MSEPLIDDVAAWLGHPVVGPDGDKIGWVDDLYVDDDTGRPTWLAVKTGLFGGRASLVPLWGVSVEGDRLRVAYAQTVVEDAPNLEPDGELSEAEQRQLYEYYRTSGDLTGAGDAVVTRAEEELRVGIRRTAAGRVRLRKYIVTEHVAETVLVRLEEIRMQRQAIVDAGPTFAGVDLSEEEIEITLHAEEVVAEKRVVPKEVVRLDTQIITEQQHVSAELRKERVVTESVDVVEARPDPTGP
jgi:uncharacterized protein (TIGR02271 family)